MEGKKDIAFVTGNVMLVGYV